MTDVADIAAVRLLIADTDPDEQIYSDGHILQFLAIEHGHPRRAAARALETYAAHIAQVAGPIRGLLDLRLGGEQSADVLLDVAARLRGGRLTSVPLGGGS